MRDMLGRYGDSKSDSWATFSDRLAANVNVRKCAKEEKLKTNDMTDVCLHE